MNQRIGICFHGTRILPISIAHEGSPHVRRLFESIGFFSFSLHNTW